MVTTLIAEEVARDGEGARKRWEQWLAIDESRDEWEAAIRRAKKDPRWATFSDDERIEYVRLLLSPFSMSSALVDRFVLAVNQSTE